MAAGLVASQQMGGALGFLTRHPEAMWTVLGLSSAATIGQSVGVHSCPAGDVVCWLDRCKSSCGFPSGLVLYSALRCTVHLLHNQNIWCPGICHHYDYPPVPVHPVVMLPVLPSPLCLAMVGGQTLHIACWINTTSTNNHVNPRNALCPLCLHMCSGLGPSWCLVLSTARG
jgi:hypothetical protein